MKYLLMDKEAGWLLSANGKVVEFDEAAKCLDYMKKAGLEDRFMIVVEGIDEKKNKEYRKYLG